MSDAELRVAFVITGLGTGGAEMMLLKLMENSSRLRSGTVFVLGHEGELSDRFRAIGVEVVSLGIKRMMPNPLSIVRLSREFRARRTKVVSTWLYHADLIGGLAARLAGLPVVWGVRSSELSPTTTRLATRLVLRMCAGLSRIIPSKIVSCSTRAVDVHVALGYPRERFDVIPNGFDLKRFRPDHAARLSVRTELDVPLNAPLVGMIARFDDQKNHRGFIEFARKLTDVRTDVRFVLAGKNVDASNRQLAQWIHDAGLGSAIRLLGLRDDVPRLNAALDVAVLTSSWGEAFPNVLGEAMACGVVCVATDVGDTGFVIGDGSRVVDVGDMAALATAVNRILALDPKERVRLERNVRLWVETEFEIGVVARRFEEVLRCYAGSRGSVIKWEAP